MTLFIAKHRLAQLLFIFFSTVLGFGCSSTPEIMQVGSNVSSAYIAPEDYSNHRAQQQFFQTKAGRIAYTDHGDGPALIMLHGVPSSSWMYRKMIAPLQSTHRVIAIDLLGYGSSDKPKIDTDDVTALNNTYGYKSQADYVEALINSLGIKQFNLLFHDMGGLVAWEINKRSINQPGRIQNLFILNTIINQKGFDHPRMVPGFISKQFSKSYSNEMTSSRVLRTTFINMGFSPNRRLSEAECEGYVLPLHEGSDRALYQFFTGFDQQFFNELDTNISSLKNYYGNAYVFWGDKDKVLTSHQLEALYPNLNLPIGNRFFYGNNGHFLAEEVPDSIVKIIQRSRNY